MAIAVVAHVAAQSSGGAPVTTGNIDTTGATLLVMCIGHQDNAGTGVPSDSKSNTWSLVVSEHGLANPFMDMWYVANPTSVGSGHNFTACTGFTAFPSVCVIAFSGTDTSAAFDQTNHGNTSGSTGQPGSVTPSVDNEVLVTGRSGVGAAGTIDSSFTVSDAQGFVGGNAYACDMAYLIETTATAKNPTWTSSGETGGVMVIATFKAAGAAGPTVPQEMPGVINWPIDWGPRYV